MDSDPRDQHLDFGGDPIQDLHPGFLSPDRNADR